MTTPDHIPVRMLNEWTYCPRLGVLMWVHAEFEHNQWTVDGVRAHRRVDRPSRAPESTDGEGEELQTRSLWLSSDAEGLTARMDVVELREGEAVPVDYKRGKKPSCPEGAWEPERVQLCAQGLVLRDHGYTCERGHLYFVESRQRVEVPFDEPLVARTRELAASFRAAADVGTLPPPLEYSRKCGGCSLVGLCLPDETRLLAESGATPERPRRLVAPAVDGAPLYVDKQGARVGVRGGCFVVRERGSDAPVTEVRVRDTWSINLLGMVQMSTQALRAAMDAGVPVCWFTYGGWFIGMAHGHPSKNIVLRQAQFAAANTDTALAFARSLVRGKIRNQRTLLRRNAPDLPKRTLRELARLADSALVAESADSLLGFEGAAARLYFRHLPAMIREPSFAESFTDAGRNRRPPRDPVNAALGFAYSLLTREASVALQRIGFDPYLGFYHAPRYGKPALALDLMEEFRPLIADSVVISAMNNNELTPASFYARADGCQLTAAGRKSLLRAYERRMNHTLQHPLFGYSACWRRIIDIQGRLLGRYLLGELPEYTPIETR